LRALSQGPEVVDGTKLWVDALCINQSDHEERASRVKRMGDIFELARLVLAGLDRKTKTNIAMDFMRNFLHIRSLFSGRHWYGRRVLRLGTALGEQESSAL
jgi:hypothetical protein